MRLHRIETEANHFAVWKMKLKADAAAGIENTTEIEQYHQRYLEYVKAVRAGGSKEAQAKRYERALVSCP